jgi:hypothetical protein
MSTIDLSGIWFRSYLPDDEEFVPAGPPGLTGGSINLSGIKYRTWTKTSSGKKITIFLISSGSGITAGNAYSGSDTISGLDPVIDQFEEQIYIYMPESTASVGKVKIIIITSPSSSLATASALVPTIKITAASVAAIATASVVAPIIKRDNTVVSPVAVATASVVAPVIQKNAMITSVAAISTGSIITPTIVVSVSSVSLATASSVAQTPRIEITSQAIATASVVAPVISIGGSPLISAPAAIATASVSVPVIINSGGLFGAAIGEAAIGEG